VGVPARVLRDSDQARHAAAAHIFGADGVAGALWSDHEHIHVGTRFNEAEVDVEPVREGEGASLAHIFAKIILPDGGLGLVRSEDHHDVRPFGGILVAHHLEAGGARLCCAGRTFSKRDCDVRDARILEVLGVGVTLAAVTDDGHLATLDESEIGIPIVIDAHLPGFPV